MAPHKWSAELAFAEPGIIFLVETGLKSIRASKHGYATAIEKLVLLLEFFQIVAILLQSSETLL